LKLKGFEVLSRVEVEEVHEGSLGVLEQFGVEIQNAKTRDLLLEAGAFADGEGGRIRIPRCLVEDSLAGVSHEFCLYDRNLSPAIELQPGRIFATTGSNSKLVVDLATGHYRPSAKKDAADFARLADGLDNISIVIPEVNPQDVPPESTALHALEAAFGNTVKHVLYEVHDPDTSVAMFDMAQAIAGEVPLSSRSPLSVFCSPTSPLVWSDGAVVSLVETARRGVPCFIIPCPLPGMTSPVSLAGTLVQQGAEFLSGVVIMQLVRRGTPLLYFAPPMSVDMRYGSVVYSGPEVMLLGVAGRQMAEFYRVPLFQSGFDTDAQCEDTQSSLDKALSVLCSIGGAAAVFKNAGSIGNGLIASATHLVLDDEFFGICLRLMEGVEVSQDTMAVEVIGAVGPGGTYLNQPHTLRNLRREHRIPKVLNRLTFDRWRAQGAKTAMTVAKERATAILEAHQSLPLDFGKQAKLREICDAFERSHVSA
jgi:trimethylamine--corrinoid protein Co-methyltransferase